MTTVLAFDLSMTRTGWALGSSDGTPPKWGVFETSDWPKNQGRELFAFRQLLDSFTRQHLIDLICVEHVFVDANPMKFQFNGTEGQMMLKGVLEEFAYSKDIRCASVAVADWRQYFLGLNRRPKEAKGDEKYWKDLALRVAAQRNWYCTWHDEAEALGIMDYALFETDKNYRQKMIGTRNRIEHDHDLKRGAFAE